MAFCTNCGTSVEDGTAFCTSCGTSMTGKPASTAAAKKIKYEIKGGQLPVAVCELEDGQEMFTESGGMSWMSNNISMSTNMEGGLLKGLGRKLSGESFFMASYKACGGPGMIAFASGFPGSIIVRELAAGESIICQKRSFLAAARTVTLAMHFQQNFGAGLFGGEGFIMQRITGPGTVFLEIDGAAIEYDLAGGQVMKVDTGSVALLEDSVNMNITAVSGLKNVFFGGEGLFLTTLTGPGHIWLQSMPVENMAKSILPFFHSQKGRNKSFGFKFILLAIIVLALAFAFFYSGGGGLLSRGSELLSKGGELSSIGGGDVGGVEKPSVPYNPTKVVGGLTVIGVPATEVSAVMVFPAGTDISTFKAFQAAMGTKKQVAFGGKGGDGGNVLALTTMSPPGPWKGSGSFPVLLIRTGTADKPAMLYLYATVSFSNGIGAVNYTSFKPVALK